MLCTEDGAGGGPAQVLLCVGWRRRSGPICALADACLAWQRRLCSRAGACLCVLAQGAASGSLLLATDAVLRALRLEAVRVGALCSCRAGMRMMASKFVG